MSSQRAIFFLTLLIIAIMSFSLNAAWFETEDMSVGNFSVAGGAFHEIPKSPYVIFGGMNDFTFNKLSQKLVLFDVSTGRCKGTYIGTSELFEPVIMTDSNNGWNIYFAKYEEHSSMFGKLHITNEGQFGDTFWFIITSPLMVKYSFCIPSRNEAWFVADKIYRLETNSDRWTTFDFPKDWNSEFTIEKVVLMEDQKELFIYSTHKDSPNPQGIFIYLETASFGPVISIEKGDYGNFMALEKWKNHDNQYLFLYMKALSAYNSITGKFELLIDNFLTQTENIMQSEDGKNLYIFKYTMLFTFRDPWLYELNLEEKTIKEHSFPLDVDWMFYNSPTLPYFDRENNRIITLAFYDSFSVSKFHKPVIIDLTDFSMDYIPGIEFHEMENFAYNHEEQKIIASGIDFTHIITANINSGELKHSIPLSFKASSISTTHGSQSPDLIGNSQGKEFIKFLPISRREVFKTASKVKNISQYMDGTRAFVSEDSGYKEYLLDDGSSEDIQLSYGVDKLYSDSSQNMIIGIGGNALQFIKPRGQVSVFKSSDENNDLKAHAYDPDNEYIWLIYKTIDGQWFFYKVSANSFVEIDSFTLQSDSFSEILNFVLDPSQRYLYLINNKKDIGIRELVIIDIDTKHIVKRITLQTEVNDTVTFLRTCPGVIPVPSKESLFLWDHYGSWSINTSNLGISYGNSKSNPEAGNSISDASKLPLAVQGYWNENKEQVIVVDLSYFPMDISDKPIVLRIDLDTGELLQKIVIQNEGIQNVFFPANQDEIYLLNSGESKLYTLHLDPAWETPATIAPSTNYIQLGEGDNAKFTVNVKNAYDFAQNATAYIWMYAPDGTMLFFSSTGISLDISGIPLSLPANLDITGDILTFTMPAGVPEGFYNFNAVFVNENGDRGPIGTWNFYVKD
jgi:hypothetical protein